MEKAHLLADRACQGVIAFVKSAIHKVRLMTGFVCRYCHFYCWSFCLLGNHSPCEGCWGFIRVALLLIIAYHCDALGSVRFLQERGLRNFSLFANLRSRLGGAFGLAQSYVSTKHPALAFLQCYLVY